MERVKRDLGGWKLSRCIWVMDRGMNSEENRMVLQQVGGHYILGEKMRDAQAVHEKVLARGGRYQKVRDNLEVKEILVGTGERRRRFILAYNPEQAKRDQLTREKTLKGIEEELAALPDQKGKAHQKAVCALLSHRIMGRYLRQQKSGAIKIDRAQVKSEERLDGKYLLSTKDDSLRPEDVALGYQQLLEVERAFRTLKTSLELRPLYHRREDRIRAHVLLCFLALLLVRVAERETGRTWDQIRAVLQRIQLGEFVSREGRVLQRTELTPDQQNLLKSLNIPPPPLVQRVDLKPPICRHTRN